MRFTINRDLLLKSLTFVQGVVERRNTLPILANVLLDLKNGKLNIAATDLDIVFYDEISDLKIFQEGSTTTSANVLYDIIRKISPGTDLSFDLADGKKLSLKTKVSDFNLNCLPAENFPSIENEFKNEKLQIDNKKFLSLLNKTKISMSNDDTRHYLNGVFLHLSEDRSKTFLTGVSTDSHRLSSSSLEINKPLNFTSLIIPRKTVLLLINLLSEIDQKILINSNEDKIEFSLGQIKLVSKVIDGKFPDYKQVVPQKNNKALVVPTKEFVDSIERVTTVSLDRKEGLKMDLNKNSLKLSVNSSNSGEGNEIVNVEYSSDKISVSFNSKYLLDIASQIEDSKIRMMISDASSPVLVEDLSDKDSYYVIMPMKF